MATIDDLITQLKVAINRPAVQDGGGNDVSTAWFPQQINMALRRLQRRLVGPPQTYTWQIVTAAGQQAYPLQEAALPAGVGDYRATKSITLPYQSAAVRYGYGLRLNYLPHALARTKYQFLPNAPIPPPLGQGFPCDYSIFWSNAVAAQTSVRWSEPPEAVAWNSSATDRWSDLVPSTTTGVGYWIWPVPDAAYTLDVDQLRFLPDLAPGTGGANWFTIEVPDLVLAEAALVGSRVLGDETKAARFLADRDEAYNAAQIMQALQFDESVYSQGMMEMG